MPSMKVRTGNEWKEVGRPLNLPIGVPYGGTGATTLQGVKNNLEITNPNLLDNWYFADPVNSKGQTSYTSVIYYGIDRWKNNSAACLLTVEDGFIRMSNNPSSTSTATQYLCQPIENPAALAGKTVTFSAYVRGDNVCLGMYANGAAVSTFPAYQTLSDFTLLTITETMPETITENTWPVIQTPNGGWFEAVSAKLELGTVSTLANDPPPNKNIEAVKCNGAASITKLWENASPTSAFAAQTISVDLSDADLCMIIFDGQPEDTNINTQIAPIGSYVWLQSFWNYRYTRAVQINSNSIEFRGGNSAAVGSKMSSNNMACVPKMILKIKGVR